MTTIPDFFAALQYTWMQRALISAILIGVICSIIGVFIVLRGMIFLGEAIAHSAFAGAALAILLGWGDPIYMILIFGLATAIGVNYVNEKEVMRDEVIVGILFTAFMALAILFIGLMASYNSNVQSILFGRILLITKINYYTLIFFAIIITAIIIGLRKQFFLITFNEVLARSSGMKVTLLNYLFMILIALAIDVSITAIGAILVFAMLITPAAAALQLTYRFDRMMMLGVTFGILSSVFGLFFSYMFNLPSGSTIVLVSTIIFGFCYLVSPKRKALKAAAAQVEVLPHFHPEDSNIEAYKEHLRDVAHKEEDA